MTLRTWREEFYPVPADIVSEEHAVTHSINKFEGLRKANLKKHDVYKHNKSISNDAKYLYIQPMGSEKVYKDDLDKKLNIPLSIDGTSCVLCILHEKKGSCITCPIYLYKKTKSSIARTREPCSVEYITWLADGNPEPMIELLYATQEWEKENSVKDSSK